MNEQEPTYQVPIIQPASLSPEQTADVTKIILANHETTGDLTKDAFRLGVCYALGLLFGGRFLYSVYQQYEQAHGL